MNLSAKLNHTLVKRKTVTRIVFTLMLGSSSLLQATERESFRNRSPTPFKFAINSKLQENSYHAI